MTTITASTISACQDEETQDLMLRIETLTEDQRFTLVHRLYGHKRLGIEPTHHLSVIIMANALRIKRIEAWGLLLTQMQQSNPLYARHLIDQLLGRLFDWLALDLLNEQQLMRLYRELDSIEHPNPQHQV